MAVASCIHVVEHGYHKAVAVRGDLSERLNWSTAKHIHCRSAVVLMRGVHSDKRLSRTSAGGDSCDCPHLRNNGQHSDSLQLYHADMVLGLLILVWKNNITVTVLGVDERRTAAPEAYACLLSQGLVHRIAI